MAAIRRTSRRMPIPEDGLVLRGLGAQKPAADRFGLCVVVADPGGPPRKLLTVERRRGGLRVAHAVPGGVHRSYAADGATQTRTGAMKIDARKLPPLADFSGMVLFQQGSTSIEAAVLDALPVLEPDDDFDPIVQLDPRRLRTRRVRHDVWLVEPYRHAEIPLPPDRPLHLVVTSHTRPWIAIVLSEEPSARKKKGG